MRRPLHSGFTLTELAVVVFVLALLIGGLALTVQAQNDAREIGETQRILDQAREAVVGFAVRNGRLPCPATTTSGGAESFCVNATGLCDTVVQVPPAPAPAHGRCSAPFGFVPATSLEIGPIQPAGAAAPGALTDSWQQPVRYVVTQVDAPAIVGPPAFPAVTRPFTSPGGLRQIVLRDPALAPDLLVCSAATGLVIGPPDDAACGAGVNVVRTSAMLFSTGKNAIAGGAGNDDLENLDADLVFVSNRGAPGHDDIMTWISTNILFNRLIGAGAL